MEGYDVARWLQAKGIAAFVLKYRLLEKREEGIPAMNMDSAGQYDHWIDAFYYWLEAQGLTRSR